MQIYFAKVSKKSNSTKRPQFSGAGVYAHMKEETDVLNPTLIVQTRRVHDNTEVDEFHLNQYNYVYIPAWNRYYYIVNVRMLDAERTEIQLSVDVMASWKDDIMNSYAIFTRTPSGNNEVIENELPIAKTETVKTKEIQLFASATNIGIYLDIAGQADPSCNPTTTTYYMTVDTLKQLMQKVYSPETYGSAGEVMDLISRTVCNPSQYIVGCRIGRLDIRGEAVTSIKFGWEDIPVTGAYKLPNNMYVTILSRDISFTDAVNDNRYKYAMYIPTVGQFDIPANDIGNGAFHINASVDMSNGVMYTDVINSKGKRVFSGNGQALVPLPITGVMAKIPSGSSLVTSAIGGAVGAVAQNAGDIWDSIKGLWNYAGSEAIGMANMNMTTSPLDVAQTTASTAVNGMLERSVKTVGGSGTISELFVNKNIVAYTFYHPYIANSNRQGKADYFVGKPQTTGFYRASYIELVSSAWIGERQNIVNTMKSGFYLE